MVATYKYDASGLRTEKTVTQNGVTTTTNFVYDSGKLITEYTGTSRVDYLYDENGMLYGFIYNNSKYFYIRDALKNILGIVDANGDAVVHYDYTAYGECTEISGSMANTIGVVNSFRYKGYYFDDETEFFYCNARYYSSEFRRFICVDSVEYLDTSSIDGMNLYCYCNNNPVNRMDPTGNWSIWATVSLAVGAAICIAAVTVLTCGVGTATLVGAVAVGAAKGALIGAAVGATVGAGVGYATTGTLEGTLEGAAIGLGVGAVVGAATGAKAGAGSWYNSMAKEFTNAGTSEVVLGRSGTYEAVAQSRGSTYFHASDARWSEVQNMFGVGSRGMWKINKAFLNQQISAGSTFALANNPAISGGYFFMKEVAYLASKGISMIPIF